MNIGGFGIYLFGGGGGAAPDWQTVMTAGSTATGISGATLGTTGSAISLTDDDGTASANLGLFGSAFGLGFAELGFSDLISGGGEQKVTFGGSFGIGGTGMLVSDTANSKGFQYVSDFSAVGTLDPRWVPDYGAVTAAISAYTLTNVLTAGNTTANGQTIDALNGGGQLDLRQGSNSVVALTTDNGGFTQSWWFGNTTVMQVGYGSGNWFEADALEVKMKVPAASAPFVSVDFDEIKCGKAVALTADTNPFLLFSTVNATTLVAGGSTRGIVLNNSGALTYNAGVTYSSAISVSGGTIKTNSTAYTTQIGFIRSGDAFESLLVRSPLTADVTHTLQASSGILAHLSDFDTGQTYTVTNGVTDRIIDLSSFTLDELGDFVGTLVADLQAINILN